jgi:hypothetical protein
MIPSRGREFYSFPMCPDWLWDLPILLSNRYWGLFHQGVKQPEHEADHSPPFKVRNVWNYTSTSHYLVEQRDLPLPHGASEGNSCLGNQEIPCSAGKGKVILCLTKYHAMKTYPVLN